MYLQDVIFCGNRTIAEDAGIDPTLVNNAVYLNLSLENLSDIGSQKCKTIWLLGCQIDALFGEDDIVEEMWTALWKALIPSGVLAISGIVKKIGKTVELEDFNRIVRRLNAIFILIAQRDDLLIFRKIYKMLPDIVTTEQLNDLLDDAKDVTELFQPYKQGKEVCDIVTKYPKIYIGGGADGDVFHFPSWRSDVVIKKLESIAPYDPSMPRPFDIEIEGRKYGTRDFLEVFVGSLLNDLATGESQNGFTIHLPRFTGFFTCPHEGSHDLYIIEEKFQTDMQHWIETNPTEVTKLKIMIWQVLYTLVSLSELKWVHFDCSPRNIFVQILESESYFDHQQVGKAGTWVYRLNDKEWKLKNVNIAVKIADFGYMHHFDNPQLALKPEISDIRFRVIDKFRRGVDIGYFMASLAFNMIRNPGVFKKFEPLYEEFLELMGTRIVNIEAEFDKLLKSEPTELDEFFEETSRLKASFENIDFSSLLDSKFFSDVMKH